MNNDRPLLRLKSASGEKKERKTETEMHKHRQADMKITSSSVCVHQLTCITRDRRVPSAVIDFACICANQYLRQWDKDYI